MTERARKHPYAMTVIQEGLVKAMTRASEAFAESLTDEFFLALMTIEAEAEQRGLEEGFRRGMEARARSGTPPAGGDGDWRANARRMIEKKQGGFDAR